MGCKKFKRIRSVDVGRPGHHRILIGVRDTAGPRGGHTEKIGGLRKYRTTTNVGPYTRSRPHKAHPNASYSLGKNPYHSLTEGWRIGAGEKVVNVTGHLRHFNAREIVRKDMLGIGVGLIDPSTLTKKQRMRIIQEQDKLSEEKRHKARERRDYAELVESGRAW